MSLFMSPSMSLFMSTSMPLLVATSYHHLCHDHCSCHHLCHCVTICVTVYRTAVNAQSGVRTQLGGVFTGLFLVHILIVKHCHGNSFLISFCFIVKIAYYVLHTACWYGNSQLNLYKSSVSTEYRPVL